MRGAKIHCWRDGSPQPYADGKAQAQDFLLTRSCLSYLLWYFKVKAIRTGLLEQRFAAASLVHQDPNDCGNPQAFCEIAPVKRMERILQKVHLLSQHSQKFFFGPRHRTSLEDLRIVGQSKS
ncbi:MAG: hypothetical protein WBC67_15505, partial [Candidatus Acidiferrales bacterium]